MHLFNKVIMASSGGSDHKEPACDVGDLGSIRWVDKIPWRRKWQPCPIFLPRNLHRQMNWWTAVHGFAKSDMTEQVTHKHKNKIMN